MLSLEKMASSHLGWKVAPHLKWLMQKYIFDYEHDKSGRLDLPEIGVGGTVIKYLNSADIQ